MKTISATELYYADLPPIGHIIGEVFEDESLIYIAGTPGSFKTGLMLFLSLCAAKKEEMMGFPIKKPLNTLFIDEENGLRRTKHKLVRLMKTMGVTECNNVYFSCFQNFRLVQDRVKELEREIVEKNLNIIILDSFVRVFNGNEKEVADVRKVHDLLKPLMEKYHVTIFILHHLRKQDMKKGFIISLDDIRGSGDIGGQCDQAFLLNRVSFDEKTFSKTFSCVPLKEKDGVEGKGFNFVVKGDPKSEELRILFGGYITERIEKAYADTKMDILKLMSDGVIRTASDIIKLVKHKKSAVLKCLKELADSGELECKVVGKKTQYSMVPTSMVPI